MRLFDEMTGIKHSSRRMQSNRLFCFLLACGVALNAGAQVAPPATAASTNSPVTARKTRALSLADCIQLALDHNLDIQIKRYDPMIDQFALSAVYGVYEPLLNFATGKTYNDRPGGFNPQTGQLFPPNITEADNYTPEITGLLPTGMTYDLFGTWSRESQRSTTTPGYWLPPDWISGPGITLTQPLLKNFWIDKNRLTIELDKRRLKVSKQELRRQIMATVTSVKSAYFTLLYNRGNVEANATALQLAQQLVSENLKRVEVGALAPLDEKQSESQAAASQAALQAAQQALVMQENTLKNLLTDKYSEWVDTSPIPSEQLMALPQELNLQESFQRGITQRPELIEAKLNIESQNVTLKYDHNQIFPELDIKGTYGRNAFNSSFSGNLSDLQAGSSSYYSYQGSVSIPLGGNRAARSTYKSDKATLQQLLLQLKQTEQGILVSIDNDVGQVRSDLQQVDATRAARVYAEDALAAEKKKLENGKSTSFIVLQLISTLTTARVNEVQALANYNIALAQLALDEGSTLEANHIDLSIK